MPEGPELHLAAQFVRSIGHRHLFSGAVVKSEVSLKNPDVPWNRPEYRVNAVSRGKEMKVFLEDVKSKETSSILFRFGMSGKFEWTSTKDLPKHAHLRFFSKEGNMVLSFVDYRRFGRWSVNEDWSSDRGPCVITESQLFRQNVLDHLDDKAFDRPLCETMLNQKYFNGVGNYLRAEVLYRLKIRPFEKARTVLAPLAVKVESNGEADKETKGAVIGSNNSPPSGAQRKAAKKGKAATKDANVKIKETKDSVEVKVEKTEDFIKVEETVLTETKGTENKSAPAAADGLSASPYLKQPEGESCDILELTHRLAQEVVGLGFDGGYFSETRDKWESGFGQWLRCYFKEGMSSVKDHNGRTMWFQGDVGPMAPAGVKRGTGKGGKKEKKKNEGQLEEDENESPKKKAKKESPKKPLRKGKKGAQEKKENVDSKKKTTTKVSSRSNSLKKEKTESAPGVRRSVRLINSNDGGSYK